MNEQIEHHRPTIAEIAKAAGVSTATVSKVLNQRSDVGQSTRDHVAQIIEKHGYVRNRAASVLRKGLSGLVELVVPGLDVDYYLLVISGVEEVLSSAHVRLVLSTTHNEAQQERQWLANVLDKSTDGVLLLIPYHSATVASQLRAHHIPFVIIDDRSESDPSVPSVGSTNWAGSWTATEYLLSLGHRRIAMISGTPSLMASRMRIAAYSAALQAAGITPDPALLRMGDYLPGSGYRETCELLALPEPPTAILASNDLEATGVYLALYERGILVPEQMSVVGFDDIPSSALATPPLTTIHQPLKAMGKMAAEMLLKMIAGEQLETGRVELATSLVVRKSCAPPYRRQTNPTVS
ncbi:LacI family transcriptional regulator [Dictyobacter sp. S3.2.2.5]|uniref:LacI family transcriptional regulator n=1 Tax=Dictyobacter halimunensis TaxID=3026934 RepID=A0ABQ6FJ41_9CHLR|nr:LacI family transcriptional regulator [Dictyobacter sp. S3.2.2.5]